MGFNRDLKKGHLSLGKIKRSNLNVDVSICKKNGRVLIGACNSIQYCRDLLTTTQHDEPCHFQTILQHFTTGICRIHAAQH